MVTVTTRKSNPIPCSLCEHGFATDLISYTALSGDPVLCDQPHYVTLFLDTNFISEQKFEVELDLSFMEPRIHFTTENEWGYRGGRINLTDTSDGWRISSYDFAVNHWDTCNGLQHGIHTRRGDWYYQHRESLHWGNWSHAPIASAPVIRN
jgi:hypothetical protein